jgi:hypothetical protein
MEKLLHLRRQRIVTRNEHVPKAGLERGAYRLAGVKLMLVNTLHS